MIKSVDNVYLLVVSRKQRNYDFSINTSNADVAVWKTIFTQ